MKKIVNDSSYTPVFSLFIAGGFIYIISMTTLKSHFRLEYFGLMVSVILNICSVLLGIRLLVKKLKD